MKSKPFDRIVRIALLIWLTFLPAHLLQAQAQTRLSLTLRNADLVEVMEMLSRRERVNILMSNNIGGEVSVNLYDVTLDKAIRSIAAASGYAIEYRDDTYFVMMREAAGKYSANGLTELRTFKVEYSDAGVVESILKSYLSEHGKITLLPQRKLIAVEDLPNFLDRIENLLTELDRQPRQILIEAKILEVTLRESESFGIDWTRLFESSGGDGSVGARGLTNITSPGLFFRLVNPDVEIFLNALRTRGKLRTLSTPKILALEDQEAEAIIGDRLGFRVTTTINEVTTESVEFLESGVILRVKPSVDGRGRIMLDIHPEVSTATVSDDGIPSQTTTEVTTKMLVQDGQTIFIGGLIKRTMDESREDVPVLGDIPLINKLFSNKARSVVNTETIVLITPYIVGVDNPSTAQVARTRQFETLVDEELNARENKDKQDNAAIQPTQKLWLESRLQTERAK